MQSKPYGRIYFVSYSTLRKTFQHYYMRNEHDVELGVQESYNAFWAIETSKQAIVDRMRELGGEEFSEGEYDTLKRMIYYFTTVGQRLLYVSWRWRTPTLNHTIFDDMLSVFNGMQLGDTRSVLTKWNDFYVKHEEEEE